MTATLKKLVGEAGAGHDKSHGSDTIYDVFKALAEASGEVLPAYQVTVAAATIASLIADKATTLAAFNVAVATTGTAGATTVQAQVNGSMVSELTVDNTDADGTKVSATPAQAIAAGDLVELVVTAAPTAGAGLTATARLKPVTVE